MGMFDYVTDLPDQVCRKCAAPLHGWQSKDGECLMLNVPFWRCMNFYTSCSVCRTWHEYVLRDHGARPLSDYRLLTDEPPMPSPTSAPPAESDGIAAKK
jgi:hypothetical protein